MTIKFLARLIIDSETDHDLNKCLRFCLQYCFFPKSTVPKTPKHWPLKPQSQTTPKPKNMLQYINKKPGGETKIGINLFASNCNHDYSSALTLGTAELDGLKLNQRQVVFWLWEVLTLFQWLIIFHCSVTSIISILVVWGSLEKAWWISLHTSM